MMHIEIEMEIVSQPGESLRQAREAAGLSVSDVVHRMKFPKSVVLALEQDDYTIFPSPTYARSYLSQYAEFVGVDPSKWLDFFAPADFAGPQDVLSMIESPVHQESRSASSGTKGGGTKDGSGGGSMLPTILLILLTAGLIYGAISGYTYLESRLGGQVTIKTNPQALPAAASSSTAPGSPATALESPPPADPATSIVTPPTVPPVETGPPPRAMIIRED